MLVRVPQGAHAELRVLADEVETLLLPHAPFLVPHPLPPPQTILYAPLPADPGAAPMPSAAPGDLAPDDLALTILLPTTLLPAPPPSLSPPILRPSRCRRSCRRRSCRRTKS